MLAYSTKTRQEDIFIKTLEGVNKKEINQYHNAKQGVVRGCEMFKGKKIDEIRERMGIESKNLDALSVGGH